MGLCNAALLKLLWAVRVENRSTVAEGMTMKQRGCFFFFSNTVYISTQLQNFFLMQLILMCRDQADTKAETAVTLDNFPTVTFTLYLRRKPIYYVVNLILPCCLLSMISSVTFLLPPASPQHSAICMYTYFMLLTS